MEFYCISVLLTLYLLLSSADSLLKHFRPRSGQTNWLDLGPNFCHFDGIPKSIFEHYFLKKKQHTAKRMQKYQESNYREIRPFFFAMTITKLAILAAAE